MIKKIRFITDIKSSHNFILFHKDLRSRIASSTARSLSKDNFCYITIFQNQSTSGHIWQIRRIQNFFFSRFFKISRQKVLFFYFFKKSPSFHCQKFLDLKSLWKCRKLWVLLIFVMKTGGFLIRSLAKVVRKSSKWKNEK